MVAGWDGLLPAWFTRLSFAMKISTVVVLTNVLGAAIFLGRRRAAAAPG